MQTETKTHPFIPEEIPDRPQVDHRWRPADFGAHAAAEGIDIHASPRFGGPPILSIALGAALLNAAGNIGLQVAERQVLTDAE